jgi:modification methylase
MSQESKNSKDVPSTRVFFGDLRKMNSTEVADGEVSLIVTSPPYFNAPFDYPDLFPRYEDYLNLIRSFASQSRRVLG